MIPHFPEAATTNDGLMGQGGCKVQIIHRLRRLGKQNLFNQRNLRVISDFERAYLVAERVCGMRVRKLCSLSTAVRQRFDQEDSHVKLDMAFLHEFLTKQFGGTSFWVQHSLS